jgi:hypothetical protein
VVNNIDAPASIYENVAPRSRTSHYLAVRLEGEGPNRNGVGAKLVLTTGRRKQYLEQMPYRGFMSPVDDRLLFGLGAADRADMLEVFWPDGRYQLLTDVAADRTITLRQRDASGRYRLGSASSAEGRLFHPVEPLVEPDSTLRNPFETDYSVQPLLPYQLSSEGPPIAVADVDGDGLEDVFLGGGDGSPGRLLLQQRDGGFRAPAEPGPWAADPSAEDRGALFFDANGDRRPDLYVARGGYTAVPGSERLQDRLYLNQGQGRFSLAGHALPPMRTSTAAVAAADYDGDGRLDLFVGGRLTPRDYPRPTRSYVLHNDGGRFTDVTARVAPALLEPGGMITDAVWTDFTGDGRPDLVTAGEWMPVQLWANDGARLEDVTADAGLPPMRGWWYSLAVGDLDRDGRTDLVAGNLGLNHSYTTSDSSRFGVYAGNFSGYRENDLVFTQEIDGTEFPYYGRALLGRDNDLVTMRYPTYAAFADASAEAIFGARLRSALHYQADTFASVWLRNEGGGRFTSHPLPDAAQISPIRGILVQDVDGDGNLDLVTAGNLLDTEPNTPPADAGKGLVLRGDGRGHFHPVSPTRSGFLAPLDARDLARVATPRGELVLVANHAGPLQAFLVRR